MHMATVFKEFRELPSISQLALDLAPSLQCSKFLLQVSRFFVLKFLFIYPCMHFYYHVMQENQVDNESESVSLSCVY